MSGLKSGSGDDLWSDEEQTEKSDDGRPSDPDETEAGDTEAPDAAAQAAGSTGGKSATGPGPEKSHTSNPDADGGSGRTDATDRPVSEVGSGRSEGQPYIVRRAIRDKSVQFERDERLTFFVHDDVAEGERELTGEMESALGRSVPTFDVREAVYRAALRNREDVLEELLAMGYTLDED